MYSEDCLNLNVYTPLLSSEVNSNQNLPVLIYIHGGSFAYGENSWDRQVSTDYIRDPYHFFDPMRIFKSTESFCESLKREQPEHTVDEQKIVVVNIQYRLGKYK